MVSIMHRDKAKATTEEVNMLAEVKMVREVINLLVGDGRPFERNVIVNAPCFSAAQKGIAETIVCLGAIELDNGMFCFVPK